VQVLGLNTVKALILSAHIFSQFKRRPGSLFDVDRLQAHSVRASACARRLATLERLDAVVVDDAFTAALLIDIGQLILASSLPAEYEATIRLAHARGISLTAAETETLGATHAVVGAYLLGLWNLPDAVIEAVAFSHEPGRCESQGFGALTLAHVADVLCHEIADAGEPGMPEPIDGDYLRGLGLAERVGAWREACGRVMEERAHE
jgi:HD-like signal output (HDOD) protein